MERYFKIASWVAYGVSFFLLVFNGDTEEHRGFQAFILGFTVAAGPWAANIFYLIALFLNKKYRTISIIFSGLAIMLACGTFSVHIMEVGWGDKARDVSVTPGPGFWVWFSAMILLFVSFMIELLMHRKKPEEKLPA
jgi:hypothetical protein